MKENEFKDIEEVELGKINGPPNDSNQILNAEGAPQKVGGF
jgi:hypothetical protein